MLGCGIARGSTNMVLAQVRGSAMTRGGSMIQATLRASSLRGTRVRRLRGAPERSGTQGSSEARRGGQPRSIHLGTKPRHTYVKAIPAPRPQRHQRCAVPSLVVPLIGGARGSTHFAMGACGGCGSWGIAVTNGTLALGPRSAHVKRSGFVGGDERFNNIGGCSGAG